MIKKIKLNKGNVLTKSNIQDALYKARSTYEYAKFTTYRGIYFTVNFNRDNTVEITTNTKDYTTLTQINEVRKSRYATLMRLSDYLFIWIKKENEK